MTQLRNTEKSLKELDKGRTFTTSHWSSQGITHSTSSRTKECSFIELIHSLAKSIT